MITFFAAAFSVLSRDKFQSQPGFAGQIMTYAMSFTQTLNWLIRMASEMETNVVSVERIDEYCHIPTEREWTRPSNSEPMITKEWPNNGEIDFDEFCVRYRDGLKLVLNNICIKVESGEKVFYNFVLKENFLTIFFPTKKRSELLDVPVLVNQH